MLVYEVNLEIPHPLYEEYSSWLKQHIADMLLLKEFEKAEILKVQTEKGESPILSVRYFAKNQLAIESYLDNHAEKMRNQLPDKFEDGIKVSRRILDFMGEI